MVSSSATTGAKGAITTTQTDYFKRVNALNLKNPLVVGFGISNRETFNEVCKYASGAIIGSAFVRMLDTTGDWRKETSEFVNGIIE